jgi:hypothetical protein
MTNVDRRGMGVGIGLLAILVLGSVGAGLVTYSPPSVADPTVSWSPASIYQSVGAGQSTTTTATFTATEDASNVAVRVVPALAPYVSVTPTSFSSIAKGMSYPVNIAVAASATAPLGTTTGTIQLKQGSATIAKPLPVSVDVVWPTFDGGQDLGFSIQYPPGWNVQPSGVGVELRGYVNNDMDEPHYMFETLFRTGVNPDQLPLATWFVQYLPDLQSLVESTTTGSIDGHDTLVVQVDGTDQYYWHIYVLLGTDILEIVYGDKTPELLPTYETMVDSLRLTQ